MKLRITSSVLAVLLLSTVAAAQTIYDNGPVNGETLGELISGMYRGGVAFTSNTFTVSGGNATVGGMSIWIWSFPTDHNPTAELIISSQANGGGTVYFDQGVPFAESNCYAQGLGFLICEETATWTDGPALSNGTYWVTLKNGSFPSGDMMLWDINSGLGCTSPGCPSQAQDNAGTIPSESFTILGTSGDSRSTTPKTTGLLMFGAGFVGLVGLVRHKLG